MSREKRTYQMKRRGELQERTRLRIVESTVHLHRTLGPSRTSISAVAEHAGVRRSTVYRHFPDEAALFAACTSHWMSENQPPRLDLWAAISDPDERLALALEQLYAYYRGTAQMMENVQRDEETMPIVKHMRRGYRDYMAAAQQVVLAGRHTRGHSRRRVGAAIGHALAFTTWRSLTHDNELNDHEAADLMVGLVVTAAGEPPRTSARKRGKR
jgi:AcrR family transcriptional regulator